MVKKLRGLAPLLVIVIGLLVLFYPTISNFLVMKNASRVVSNYDAAVEALSDEEYRSMIDARARLQHQTRRGKLRHHQRPYRRGEHRSHRRRVHEAPQPRRRRHDGIHHCA